MSHTYNYLFPSQKVYPDLQKPAYLLISTPLKRKAKNTHTNLSFIFKKNQLAQTDIIAIGNAY